MSKPRFIDQEDGTVVMVNADGSFDFFAGARIMTTAPMPDSSMYFVNQEIVQLISDNIDDLF